MCGLRDCIQALLAVRGGREQQNADRLSAIAFLHDLVHSYLLPQFPKEKAGAHLEVAVHASVLVRQAIDGVSAACLHASAPAAAAVAAAPCGLDRSHVRKQLLQLVDELLAILQDWGMREADAATGQDGDKGPAGDPETARIASALIRQELYASVLSLCKCLGPDAVAAKADRRVVWRLDVDAERVIADRREALVPIVLADVVSHEDYDEGCRVQLLALRCAVHILPLSGRGGLSSVLGGKLAVDGATASPLLKPHKSTSMSLSKTGRSSLRASSYLRTAPPALASLLRQSALGEHLCADFAGSTALAEVLHLHHSGAPAPQLETFVAKVELLKAIAANPVGREHLRDTGVIHTICASSILSAAMSSQARSTVKLSVGK